MSSPAADTLERVHEWVDMLGPDKLVHLETLLSYWLVMPPVLCQHLCNLCEYLAIPTTELKSGERVDLPPVGALVETISAVGDCVTQSMRHLNAGHMSLMGGADRAVPLCRADAGAGLNVHTGCLRKGNAR